MMDDLATAFLLGALRRWVEAHPGQLLAMAMQGHDLVPALRAVAFAHLPRLAPAWQALLRSRLLQYDRDRDALLAGWRKRLEGEPGEIGTVARDYPGWADDHLRRLWNLAVAWARGESVGLVARLAPGGGGSRP